MLPKKAEVEEVSEESSVAKQDDEKEDEDGVIYDPMGRKLKSK